MRLFLVYDGQDVVDKKVFEGDDSKIDSLMNQYKLDNPKLTVTEVDSNLFDSAVFVTKEQKQWQTEKAKGTNEAIAFLAKYTGLE